MERNNKDICMRQEYDTLEELRNKSGNIMLLESLSAQVGTTVVSNVTR